MVKKNIARGHLEKEYRVKFLKQILQNHGLTTRGEILSSLGEALLKRLFLAGLCYVLRYNKLIL